MGYIFRAELKKVWRKRTMWFFILLLLTGYIFYLVGEVNGKTGSRQYSYQAYCLLADSVDEDALQDETERIEKQVEKLSDKDLYTGNFYSEDALYEEVLKQMRHVADYAEFADSVADNARKGEIGLFQEDEYTKREQEKVAQDFEKLRFLPVVFAPFRGVYLLAGRDFSDAVMVIFIVLLVAALVTMEKEEKTFVLLHSTCHGRKKTGAIKFWCGVCILLAGVFLVFAIKSGILLGTYGIGNWNSPVQSVYLYGSCRYSLSVGGFLILSAIEKLTAYLALYSILFFLAIFIKKSLFMYCSCSIFMGLEGLFWVIIPEHSWLSMLKKINIISFLGSDAVIGEYQNVNLFQRPIDYAYVVLAIEIICFWIFMVLGIFSFDWCTGQGGVLEGWKRRVLRRGAYHNKLNGVFAGLEGVLAKKNGSRHFSNPLFLFCKELKKVWIGEKGFLFFMVGILFLLFLYTPLEESFSNKDELYYSGYMLKIQGKYSDEKLSWLYEERKELEKIQEELDSGTEFTSAQLELLTQKLEKYNGLEMAIQNVEYIREKGLSHIVYEKGYLTMLGHDEGKWELLKLRLIALVLMTGLAASVWGMEAWSGMDKVLRISAVGERSLKSLKRCHVFLLSLLIFAVTFIPWVWNVTHAYDCSQWAAPMGSIMLYKDAWFRTIPIGTAALCFGGLHLLYLYLAGRMICGIRKKLGNYILTVLVAFVVFGIPFFLL